VGLTLARTIVADREAHGAFGSLEALDRVPGIGPGLLAAIRDQVTFSAAGRLGDSATRGRLPVEFGGLPTSDPIPQATPESPLAGRSRPAVTSPSRPAEPLDLNTATAAELERLPFVGPYMAQQIVAYRSRHGAFPAVDSLVKVPGIGPATLAKIRGRVSAN
jgi:competence ComEA-like helix-hairpin-helix protein